MNKTFDFIKTYTLSTNQLIVITCVYIVFVLNAPFLFKAFSAILSLSEYNPFFLLSVPIFILSLAIFIQCFFAWRWITKPILILLVIMSSLVFYSTVNYGVIFDYGMIQNTVETDSAEAFSYINLTAFLFLATFGIIPAILIAKVKLTYSTFWGELITRIKLMIASLAFTLLIAIFFYSSYASIGRNNRDLIGYLIPYALIDSTIKFANNNYIHPPLKFRMLDISPTVYDESDTKNITVVVLGETARSQNFSLNGYEVPTNYLTSKLGVVSFKNVTSCGTSTAVSVPCMFSRLDKENYEKRVAIAQQNAIDLIHLAGADVFWISNNSGGCKGVCSRVASHQISTDSNNPLCDGDYCFDEVLFDALRERLYSLSSDNTLIVLHMIGSHGPTYYRRYPKDKRIFTPDCQRSDIQNCSSVELLNTYNNTIAYTDFVLSKIITELASYSDKTKSRASMIYISDHGESLGEGGVYLHGLPYAFAPSEQTQVPFVYWADQEHQQAKLDCLNNISTEPMSHDNLFDILLSEMKVDSVTYSNSNNPFSKCNIENSTPNSVTIVQGEI